MNAFAIAATVLLALLAPLGVAITFRRPADALVALELGATITVLVLLCLAESFHRSTYFTVGVVAALAYWVSGLVFVRFLGRWL